MIGKAKSGANSPAALRLDDPVTGTDTIEFADSAAMLTLSPGHRVSRPAPERGVRLSDGPRVLESGEDLFGHTAFTISIDFCREEPDDCGALISFDGSFSLALTEEELEGTVVTTRGSRTLRAALADVRPGRWHRATLTFDGATGRVSLFLDERQVASAVGLEGGEQSGNFFAELMIGGPNDASFTGLVDNFRMLDAAVNGGGRPAP